MYDIMEQDGAKAFLKSIERKSKSTKTTYAVALSHFQNFLDTKQFTLHNILEPIKGGKIDMYTLLDELVGYLLEQKNGNDESMTISPRSIKAYIAAVKSYLAYNDIDIIPAKFKRKVKMPSTFEENEEAIDAKDVREILLHINNRRLKPFLLCLASGAFRTNEATSLRIKDIDFDTSPTLVHVRNTQAHKTKTRVTRFTFISDEATKYLKEWITWRYRERSHSNQTPTENPNDLVFADRKITSSDGIYTKLRNEFSKVLKNVGRERRKEGMQRRTITLNSFRRFAKTTVSDQVSSDFSEWFIGHKHSTYWTKKDGEKQQIYKTKCMNYLTFLDYTTLEATGKSIEAKISEKENEIQLLRQRDQIKDKEMKEMKEQIETIMSSLGMINQSGKNKLARQLFKKGMYEVDTANTILNE